MRLLTSPKTYVGLAAFEVGDAVATAIPVPYIAEALDRLGVPAGVRPILPVVKLAAAIGLLSVNRYPLLARVTTAALTLYFALAVAGHVRARDSVANAAPAAAFLATFAAMTIQGPPDG